MIFVLKPKVTVTQPLITISDTPENCFTSGTSFKGDTNISIVTQVLSCFVDLLITVQNTVTLRQIQTSN
jgi:hypothetical protein